MITVDQVEFTQWDGCPIKRFVSYDGFAVTASGMDIQIASGSITIVDSNDVEASYDIASASGTVTAPASGQLCFGFWASTDFDLHFANDTSVYPEFPNPDEYLVVKGLWGYVSAGDTSIENTTVWINMCA